MKFLAIKSYWKHQHYHKRGAPWIKLHSSVLADAAFIQLPEVAQAQLMKLWSLASQLGHPLPNNPRLLAGKIGTTGKFHLAALIAAGFIVPCDTEDEGSAIAKLKRSEQNASNLLEESWRPSREIELEGEIDPSTTAAAEIEAGLAVMLESDADRIALTAVLTKARSRFACVTALASMFSGNDPAVPRPSARVFGQALRDMATNDVEPSARKIRNYIADAARPSDAAPSGSTNGRGTKPINPGAQMVANILGGQRD